MILSQAFTVPWISPHHQTPGSWDEAEGKGSVFCLQESRDQTWQSLKAERDPVGQHTHSHQAGHTGTPRLLSEPTHICPGNNTSTSLGWLPPGCSPNPITRAKLCLWRGGTIFSPIQPLVYPSTVLQGTVMTSSMCVLIRQDGFQSFHGIHFSCEATEFFSLCLHKKCVSAELKEQLQSHLVKRTQKKLLGSPYFTLN